MQVANFLIVECEILPSLPLSERCDFCWHVLLLNSVGVSARLLRQPGAMGFRMSGFRCQAETSAPETRKLKPRNHPADPPPHSTPDPCPSSLPSTATSNWRPLAGPCPARARSANFR